MSQGTKTYITLAGTALVLYYAFGLVTDYCGGHGATTRFCRRTHLSDAPAPVVFADSFDFFNRVRTAFPVGSSDAGLLAALNQYNYTDTNAAPPGAPAACQSGHEFTTPVPAVPGWTAGINAVGWCSDLQHKITWLASGTNVLPMARPVAPIAAPPAAPKPAAAGTTATPEAKTEAKPEEKTAGNAAKPDAKPDTKSDDKMVEPVKTEDKPEAKPDDKTAEAAKPDAKPDTKPDDKTPDAAKPDAKPEKKPADAAASADNRPVPPPAPMPAPAPAPDATPPATGAAPAEAPAPAPAKAANRTITVGPIIFKNPNDWTVWINGEPVKPGTKPQEIVEITVTASNVHLQWFDKGGTDKVVDVTIPAYAVYDIDKHVIMPLPAKKP